MKKITLTIYCTLFFLYGISYGQAPVVSWQHAYGGSSGEVFYDVEKTTDGGAILAGLANSNNGDVPAIKGYSDFYIIKIDANKNTTWIKTFGGSNYDDAYSVRQTTDGGYIVAGRSTSNDGDVSLHYGLSNASDWWIVKLSSSGVLQWQKTFGGTGTDLALCIQQTADGNYIVAGESSSSDFDVSSNHGNEDFWVVKLNTSGNILWEKTYGGSGEDIAKYISQTKDGGYIVAGHSYSNDGDVTGHHGDSNKPDYWVIKISATGVLQWQKSLGGTDEDKANCIRQTKDGGFLVAGYAFSGDGDVTGQHSVNNPDGWLVKLSAYGNIKWQHAYGGTSGDWANDIEPLQDGGFIISGSSFSSNGDLIANDGNQDYWVYKINASGTLQWSGNYGGANNDIAYSTRYMPDGTYFTTGLTYSYDHDAAGNHGYTDGLLLNLGTTPLPVSLNATSISPDKLCWEVPLTLSYSVTGSYNPGNIFTAQISDNNGSFINPTDIGSVAATIPGTINCILPSSIKPSPDDNYYIRVISSNPVVIGGSLPNALKLKCNNPDGLKNSNISSSSAKLSWNEASCPLSYIVKWKPTSSNNWDSTEVTTTSYSVSGLIPSTMYDWRVKEKCSSKPLYSEWSKKKNFTTAPLRLSDESNSAFADAIEVYPNPVTNLLTIKLPELTTGELIIMNVRGEQIFLQQLNSAQVIVDVSSFVPGVFFLRLETSYGVETRCFVKE